MTKPQEKSLRVVAREEGLLPFLKQALTQIDAVSTGALGTEPLHLLMIPGRLVQAARNRTFIEQLATEVQSLRDKGRIQPDFERSRDGSSSLQELLAALEDPPVDDDKFEALKFIFLAAATGALPEKVRVQFLLGIARSLSSGELAVLGTAYSVSKNPPTGPGIAGFLSWATVIAEHSGLGMVALVENYAEGLAGKNLIFPRHYPDRSGMQLGKHFGLTDFGVKLCETISAGAAASSAANGQ